MGNHDEMLRKFIPMHFGDIHMVNRVIHETNRAPKDIVEQEKTNYNNLKNDIEKIFSCSW